MIRRLPLVFIALTLGRAVAQINTLASIAVSRETAPAGAVAQIKVMLTEPMPISHGGGTLSYDSTLSGSAVGVYLLSSAGDACGTALVQGSRITLNFTSPLGALGTLPGYPFLTIAVPLRADAPAGSSAPVTLDTLSLANLLGLPYGIEVKPGSLTVAGTIAINNVLPGGGTVPAGQPILILGTGFQPGAMVRIDGFEVPVTNVLSDSVISIQFQEAVPLDGKKVSVRNPDGSSDIYFSYMRTIPLGASTQPLLASAVPIVPTSELADALVPAAAQTGVINGFAVENASGQLAQITLTMYSAPGVVAGQTSFVLPTGMRISRSIAEMLPQAAPAGTLRITATQPVRVMGLAANTVSGAVLPVPASATPAGF